VRGTATAAPGPFALTSEDHRRLAALLERALRRARRTGCETLASFSCSPAGEVDPTAVVCASRRPGEQWLCIEQPQRAMRAIAALGEAAALRAVGAARFSKLAERWRTLAASAVVDASSAVLESGQEWRGGPLALGGFAFAPDGGHAPHWDGFDPASLVVPELLLSRMRLGDRTCTHLTLTASACPDDTPEGLLERLTARLSELRHSPLPLLDPSPSSPAVVSSAMPPEHYESAVARAIQLMGEEELEKVVLAREVQVHARRPHDPAALIGVLREEFPACFVFCVGRGDATLVAASPELLVRREGQRVSTLALAGSTRRSADPAVDAHLGEQLLRDPSHRDEHAIVARRITRTLRPHAVWVAAADEPELARIANIQHLATPIRAQLAAPVDVLELAGLMHPTPAVGGEPLALAGPLIPALEGLDRGWYAGPVGWTDAAGDGEFCVALRCALLRGGVARCYAGNGIVRGSQPAAELAETEIKLAALLPLLAG
jgi:salicylate biosynthesis isochorismate synthase/menaquinone-specific isochorismate synthase